MFNLTVNNLNKIDCFVQGSQLSLNIAGSGRLTVMSRDTLRERDQLNEHVSKTYEGLTERYAGMEDELYLVDRGWYIHVPHLFSL